MTSTFHHPALGAQGPDARSGRHGIAPGRCRSLVSPARLFPDPNSPMPPASVGRFEVLKAGA